MNHEVRRQIRLVVRWALWCVPLSMVGVVATVLLVSILAVGLRDVWPELAAFAEPSRLPGLAAASVELVLYWFGAITVWALLARLLPQIDRTRWSLLICFPPFVTALFAGAASVTKLNGSEFTSLALLAPLFLGLIAVAPRLFDPSLRPGSFASTDPHAGAAG